MQNTSFSKTSEMRAGPPSVASSTYSASQTPSGRSTAREGEKVLPVGGVKPAKGRLAAAMRKNKAVA